jgi:hypothetical protein
VRRVWRPLRLHSVSPWRTTTTWGLLRTDSISSPSGGPAIRGPRDPGPAGGPARPRAQGEPEPTEQHVGWRRRAEAVPEDDIVGPTRPPEAPGGLDRQGRHPGWEHLGPVSLGLGLEQLPRGHGYHPGGDPLLAEQVAGPQAPGGPETPWPPGPRRPPGHHVRPRTSRRARAAEGPGLSAGSGRGWWVRRCAPGPPARPERSRWRPPGGSPPGWGWPGGRPDARRLVGGAVLPQADGVVGEHEHHRELHEGGHPDGRPHVVAEREERPP